jgi:hypothetical protein
VMGRGTERGRLEVFKILHFEGSTYLWVWALTEPLFHRYITVFIQQKLSFSTAAIASEEEAAMTSDVNGSGLTARGSAYGPRDWVIEGHHRFCSLVLGCVKTKTRDMTVTDGSAW